MTASAFETTDVEYLRHGDKPLLARIYRPAGKGPFPAVVEIHGGGWTSLTRTQNAVVSEALAAAGTLVASLDFRMPPGDRYPASIADINYGIRWLKGNAAKFGADRGRIGGLGSSSGAHQLLLNVLRPRDPRYAALPCPAAPDADATLGFVVACWPVADPLARLRMAQERGNEALLRNHAAYWPDEAAMEEGNPQRILERGEASNPPLLTMQGTNDDNLTPDMSERFAAAWRKAGGRAEFHSFEGQPHTFISKDPGSAASQRAIALILEFVARESAAASPAIQPV